ncbi:hypothetical protein CKO32_06415 [Afifella marina DSM 2698]|nr:hypothetical protein [Afifella marina DSM 2698]MBK1626188.1 hypothetical protein [Afifella marina]MBK5917066.1 hypothetical protein [Afifella marina]RAI22058.1 hypothetical protein CH311_04930 [Afifella marina DSM 2698]
MFSKDLGELRDVIRASSDTEGGEWAKETAAYHNSSAKAGTKPAAPHERRPPTGKGAAILFRYS